MALTGTDRGTGTHNVSSATLLVVPASNFAAGMAVLVVAADNPASGNDITGVTDTKLNTWTIRQSPVIDPGAAAAGQQGIIATTPQDGGALTTGDTITVTFGAAKVAKTWTLMQVSGSTGDPTYVIGNIGTGGTGTTSPTITTGSIASGNMVIASLHLEAGTTQTITQDADTTNGSWSTQQTAEIGSTTSGSNVASQRKVVTATGTQTYNPTLGLSGDLCLAWIELTELAPITGTGAVSVPSATVAGVAEEILTATGAVTVPTVTVAGSGDVGEAAPPSGTGTVAVPAVTVAGTGQLVLTATGAVLVPTGVVSGTGAEAFTATGSVQVPSTTVTGVGSVAVAVTGTGAIVMSAPTVSGIGDGGVTAGGGPGKRGRPIIVPIPEDEDAEVLLLL